MFRSAFTSLALVLSLSFTVAACGGDDDDNPSTDCADAAQQMRGAVVVMTSCTNCHAEDAANRNGAPDGIDFDSEAKIMTRESAIRRRAITAETMPPSGPLSQAQQDDLAAYLDCI